MGGFVLCVAGYFIVLAGFWPMLLAVIRAWILLGGEDVHQSVRFRLADGQLWLETNGWPEVGVSILVTGLIWCAAIVIFALGHALYVLRDLSAKAADVGAHRPAID